MILITNYIFIISAVIIFSGIVNALRLHISVRHLGKQHTALQRAQIHESDSWPNIIILIPALREGETIRQVLQFFSHLRYPRTKLKIVVVTTEREFESAFNSKKNTVSIAEEKINELNTASQDKLFYHIHYPNRHGVKADQLNYAIEQLQILLPNYFNDQTYIGVYDADSITPDNTLEILAKDATINGYPNIYQQPTFYFNNYKTLPLNLNGLLSKSFSWLQSAFALYHEANMFIAQFGDKKRLMRMEYCVGHGMFVRWPLLKRVGLFPTPIEDTRLGHIASYIGEKIKILPVFDSVAVTTGIKSQIKQSSVWFTGEAFVIEDLKIAKRILPDLSSRQIWLAIYKIYRNIVWITRAFLLFAVIIMLVITHNYILACLTGFLYLYLPLLIMYLDMPSIQTLTAKGRQKFYRNIFQTIGIVLVVPIEFLIMSIGPALGLFNFLAYRITKRNLYLPKTKR